MLLFNRLRLQYGLLWRKHYPTWHDAREWLRTAGFCTLIIGAYAAVAYIDDLDARAAEMEQRADAATRAAEIYRAHKGVLKNCELGAQGYYYPESQQAYLCPQKL